MIWYCPATKRASTKFTPAASTATATWPGPGSGSGRSSTRRTRGRTQLVADDGAHGRTRYRRPGGTPPDRGIRPARPDELALLPALEAAADTLFEPLGIGPLPGPGTVEEFAAALVVLVAGDPPVGLCRIDGIGGAAPTSSSSRSIPTTAGAASGGPCCGPRATGRPRDGYDELTLATYRDVPVERALLRLGGLRRGRAGRRLAASPTACRPRSRSWAVSAPASSCAGRL